MFWISNIILFIHVYAAAHEIAKSQTRLSKWTDWYMLKADHRLYILTGFCKNVQFNSIQLLSPVWCFATPWTAAWQAYMSVESVMPSNYLILCHPLLLPSIFPSIRVFSSESVLHITWPKYWSFSFNISPSKEHSGLISFKMDWLDLPAVQGTFKSLLQHHSSKASAFSFVYSPTLTSIHDYW